LNYPQRATPKENIDATPAKAFQIVYRVSEALNEDLVDNFSIPGLPDILAYRYKNREVKDIRFAEVKSWKDTLQDNQEEWIEKYSDRVPIDLIRIDKLRTGLNKESNLRKKAKEITDIN